MQVIRAAAMGMCFGVRDAIAVTLTLPSPENTTIYGELVHNNAVIDELAGRGFQSLPESKRDQLPATRNVLITAHGVSNAVRNALEQNGKAIIDTTCPLVRRAHDSAQRLQAEHYFVIVIGRADHVEVLGITGDLSDYAVVAKPQDVQHWGKSRLGVVCQTTTPPALAADITARIRCLNPHSEIRIEDTICRPTRERQLAMAELLPQVDAMVVVGGAHSNNTRQLARLAQENGVPVCHVQNAAELDQRWFCGMQAVGLTAGTSTLEETINEVESALLAIEQYA